MARQFRQGLLCAGVAMALIAPYSRAQTTSSTVPLSVSVMRVDPSPRAVTFTVQNTGTKTVSAWHVRIAVGTEPDAAGGGYGVDAFRSLEGLFTGASSYIRPNELVTATADLPQGTKSVAPVVITPTTAVFADPSFAGDATFAQSVFDQRRQQLEAWQEIEGLLQEARTRGTVDANALEQLLVTIDNSIAQHRDDVVRRTFRTNLALRLTDVRAGRAQALQVVTGMLDEASRNIAAVAAHFSPLAARGESCRAM